MNPVNTRLTVGQKHPSPLPIHLFDVHQSSLAIALLAESRAPSPTERAMDVKAESDEAVDYQRPAPIEVFARRSTLHGISHMFTYERMLIKRTLWILFFLGSVGVLALVCADRVHFYFQYPHVTRLDEVAAPWMVFPSVTFCNLNSFRFGRVTRNDLYHAGELLALLNGR